MNIQVKTWIKLYEQNDPSKNSLKECEKIQQELDNIEALLTGEDKEQISDYYGCPMFDY